MQNKAIISTFILMLVVSSAFIAFQETKKQDINSQNLWFLYFNNPKDQSIDFTIENHTDNKNFHWEIYLDKTKVKEADVSILKGESKTIPATATEIMDKRITVKVTSDENSKEIYKNF